MHSCLFLIFPLPFDQRPISTKMNCILRVPHHSRVSFDSHLRFVKMIKTKEKQIRERTDAFWMMKPTCTTHELGYLQYRLLAEFDGGSGIVLRGPTSDGVTDCKITAILLTMERKRTKNLSTLLSNSRCWIFYNFDPSEKMKEKIK